MPSAHDSRSLALPFLLVALCCAASCPPVASIDPVLVEHVEFMPDPVHDVEGTPDGE